MNLIKIEDDLWIDTGEIVGLSRSNITQPGDTAILLRNGTVLGSTLTVTEVVDVLISNHPLPGGH